MDLLEALLLGIIQGATEFLPISSSGHLVLVPWWLNLDPPPLLFTVTAHLGTTLAVLIYFWADWMKLIQGGLKALRERQFDLEGNLELRLLFLIILGTIPAGIIGLLFADYFEEAFAKPSMVSFELLITAALIAYAEWSFRRAGLAITTATPDLEQIAKEVTVSKAFFIGFAQAVAILPGISRSGTTIAAGLFRGLNHAVAMRYSFLLATPIIIAAGLKEFLDLATGAETAPNNVEGVLVIGFVSSFIVGYASIAFMLQFVRRKGLYGFALYCLVFGLISLGATLLRG